MLPKGLILVWRLGVLTVSIGSSAGRSFAIDPANILIAEFPSFEAFEIATSSPPPQARPAIRIAQNTSDQNNIPAVIPNTAKVSLQMAPDQSVSIGTKIEFRVTTRKPGYLLLVDIDPSGKMSQIFPSPEMVAQSREAATNFVKPGEELVIPNAAAQKRGYVEVALEARLAEADIEMKSGGRVAAEAQLANLESEARQQGFELIAREAAECRNFSTTVRGGGDSASMSA